MEEFLNQLNDSQRQAVEYIDGPSLVVAGAGSGKTRVLTYKIAYLLHKGLPPQSIMALTFTNKAAREMKARIATLTDPSIARRLWMGTFHSIFSRILRTEAKYIGYSSNFTIYDTADSKSLIRTITKAMQLDDKVYRTGLIQSRISNAKNALVTAEGYLLNKELRESDLASKTPLIGEIYKAYQGRCKQADAMDFDDLLLQTNILFRDHPEVLKKYSGFFQYILVDEYQDTNFAQHLIVKKLCSEHNRLCVVGDDAQSIYSFRGAKIDNILQFRNQFEGCKIFKLEQNYRSTQNIVNAANSLILKNNNQIRKNVFSEQEAGSKVFLFSTYSDYEEAYAVASQIDTIRKGNNDYSQFALLYRTNAQSRILEEALRKRGIPYKIYGGLSFYQRKEVKDLISYLRLLINPNDEEAMKRIINYPTRGIGDTTLGKLLEASISHGQSLWNILQNPLLFGVAVNKGTLAKLANFTSLIQSFIDANTEMNASEISNKVAKDSGIIAAIFEDRSVEGISKQENIQELLKGITEFCDLRKEEGEDVSLANFLSEVSLLTDQDNDKDENANKVTLMTVHAAKGLEFKNVFVVGMEEDLFPSAMSKDNPNAVEEERRLFYVALTRAEKNCILSYAKSRFRNGQSVLCAPSRFLRDIDVEYLKLAPDTKLPGPPRSEQTYIDEEPIRSGQRLYKKTTPQFKPSESHVHAVDPIPDARIPAPTSRTAVSGELNTGMRVSHERFGEGVIMGIEGTDGNAKAIVDFKHFGKKQLLLKFARLRIVE